jgi:hypothetical protein
MAFLSPAARTDSHRLPRHLILAALAVLAAAVVLALLPRREEPSGALIPASAPAPAMAAARQADPPLRAPAAPVEVATASRRVAVASFPTVRRSAPVDEVTPVRATPTDDLNEDAAAAGMTSRTVTDGGAQH